MTLTRIRPLLLIASLAVACDETAPAVSNMAASASAPVPAAMPTPTPTAAASPEAAPEKPPETVAAQHVLIAYRGAKNAPSDVKRTKADAKKLADELVVKARSGSDFTGLVKAYSEDPGTKDRLGSVGKFTPDKMVKPFSDAAFKLRVNEVSDAVETEFGFHVIKRNQ